MFPTLSNVYKSATDRTVDEIFNDPELYTYYDDELRKHFNAGEKNTNKNCTFEGNVYDVHIKLCTGSFEFVERYGF